MNIPPPIAKNFYSNFKEVVILKKTTRYEFFAILRLSTLYLFFFFKLTLSICHFFIISINFIKINVQLSYLSIFYLIYNLRFLIPNFSIQNKSYSNHISSM